MAKEREIKEEHKFKGYGTFQGLYLAHEWLHNNGYYWGSLDGRFNPVAIVKGDYKLPEKWHNFTLAEKKSVDGIITSSDWREGEVKVIIYK